MRNVIEKELTVTTSGAVTMSQEQIVEKVKESLLENLEILKKKLSNVSKKKTYKFQD